MITGQISEKPTLSELGRCLKQMAEAIEKWPYSVVAAMENDALESMFRLEGKLREAIKTINGFEIRLDELENQITDDMDRRFRHILRKREELSRKLRDLQPMPMPENVNIYGLKTLIETLESLSRMNDRDWERLRWIMTSLSEVKEPLRGE